MSRFSIVDIVVDVSFVYYIYMDSRIRDFIWVVGATLVVGVLLHTVYTMIKTAEIANRVDMVNVEVEGLRNENVALKNRLEGRDEPYFLEEIARNKLNLQRDGDIVIFIDKLGKQEEVIERILPDGKIEPIDAWLGFLF